MLLCIDIGNTNTVIGIYNEDTLVSDFRIASDPIKTADEYGVMILEMLKFGGIDYQTITAAIISSVSPGLDTTYDRLIRKYFRITPIFVGPGIKTGIRIVTDNPKQVGADLIVGAVASYQKYGAPVIYVDLGTAMKFFYVSPEKELIGGLIAPGIRISFQSLALKTAKLEQVRMDVPLSVIGKDTVSCIQSAMIHGSAAMIDGVIRKMKKEIGLDNIRVVLTGGEAQLIKNYLEEQVFYDENLLLEGLKILYHKNK